MNYLKLKTEIDEKMEMQRVSNAECMLAYSELILDMSNKIDLQKEHIDSLEEELKRLRDELGGLDERLHLRKAFGD